MSKTSSMLSLEGVFKRFDRDDVLTDFSLDIRDGEFFTLLGPSGCGKTTALRLIAGFEQPDQGSITIAGQRVENLPPEKRPVNTVFQSYALFPHMTVAGNVGFPLTLRGVGPEECAERVAEALETVQLTGLGNRRYILDRLESEVPRAIRYDEPLTILLCDVDNLDRVNEDFGQAKGDEVIETVAGVVREQVRATDFAARYDGEPVDCLYDLTVRFHISRWASPG